MRTIGTWMVLAAGGMGLLGGCADMGGVQMGSERAKTVATGSAGAAPRPTPTPSSSAAISRWGR